MCGVKPGIYDHPSFAAKRGQKDQVVFQHRVKLMKKLCMSAQVSIRYLSFSPRNKADLADFLEKKTFCEKLLIPCVYNHRN